jgi:hypothetical protein
VHKSQVNDAGKQHGLTSSPGRSELPCFQRSGHGVPTKKLRSKKKILPSNAKESKNFKNFDGFPDRKMGLDNAKVGNHL